MKTDRNQSHKYYNLAKMAKQQAEFELALDYYEKAVMNFPENSQNNHQGLLILALPKSACMYISRTLKKSLNLKEIACSSRINFTKDIIDPFEIESLCRQSLLSLSHLPPLKINTDFLVKHLPTCILHIRDPRQALLSWVHYLMRTRFENLEQKKVFLYVPNHYFSLSFHEQITWQIENHFQHLINWIEGWVHFRKLYSLEERIYLSTYEDFHNNQSLFFNKLFNFLGYDPQLLNYPDEAPYRLNFRSGKIDEWKYVFSRKQQLLLNSIIPDNLVKQFNWI